MSDLPTEDQRSTAGPLKTGIMILFSMKRIFILCAIFCAGCDFPPDEAASIREQLQAQISKGQVYVMHSSKELSFVIRNSEFTLRPDAERDRLISSVEKEALEVLEKYRDIEHIKIYFLGDGPAGIENPYICKAAASACLKSNTQEQP